MIIWKDLVGLQKKKTIEISKLKDEIKIEEASIGLEKQNIKQATKDSVRSIMLIRAYRIPG